MVATITVNTKAEADLLATSMVNAQLQVQNQHYLSEARNAKADTKQSFKFALYSALASVVFYLLLPAAGHFVPAMVWGTWLFLAFIGAFASVGFFIFALIFRARQSKMKKNAEEVLRLQR